VRRAEEIEMRKGRERNMVERWKGEKGMKGGKKMRDKS
jgi:hypothetical protein